MQKSDTIPNMASLADNESLDLSTTVVSSLVCRVEREKSFRDVVCIISDSLVSMKSQRNAAKIFYFSGPFWPY